MLPLTQFLICFGIPLFGFMFYKWATQNNRYFARRGVKFQKPHFLLGNTAGFFFKRYDYHEFLTRIYNAFPNEK